MHAEALSYVEQFATDDDIRVIEVGSRDINGSPRPLFPNAQYLGIDVEPGRGVDVVADGTTWGPTGKKPDVVVCCEVFEHTPDWLQIIHNAHVMLKVGGRFIVTAAGPSRTPHSAVDGGALRDGEFYENIDPDELDKALTALFTDVEVVERGGDVYATGVK